MKQTSITPDFEPSAELLKKYAQVLVNFALNSGTGLKAGEVVDLAVPDVAKPLAFALQTEILLAGGIPMLRLLPTGFDKQFFNLANDQQLTFFPKQFLQARAKLIDHQIGIIADPDPKELSEVDPQKIFKSRDSKKAYREWLTAKENANKFTWTIALWGMQAKADEVGLSLKEYWDQIIKACFLDHENPVAEWQRVSKLQDHIKIALDSMKIEYVKAQGPDMDLIVKIGADRTWKGGGGRNVPSFEIFTSPDWRGVEGWIKFNQPLYRYGNMVKGVELELRKGKVVHASAEVGNSLLQQMLKSKNADKIGEYSLTDKRMSHITHVMAETLFDENIGGPFGNTHLAIGMAYQDCYKGDPTKLKKADWKRLGYNDSPEHTDIISTTDRTVTAYMADGSEKVIYADGQFQV